MTRCLHLLLLAVLALSSCTTKKDLLEGQRQKILIEASRLEAEVDIADINMEISEPVTTTVWTHSSENSLHLISHAEFDHYHEILWNKSIGSGSSSERYVLAQPVIAEDMIFTLDSKGQVMARQVLSNDKVWSKSLHLKGDNICLGGGLAVVDGKLYVSFSSSDLFCLDALNGNVLWHVTLGHPIRSAPVVKNNLVYIITKQNSLITLNGLTGEKLWTHEGASEMCSCLGGSTVGVDRHVVIVPYATGEIFALKAENGLPLWSDSLNTPHHNLSSTSMVSQIKVDPVLDKNLVFVASQNGQMAAIEFKTGSRIWEKNVSLVTTPILSGNFLFALTTTGDLICMVKDTGSILWIQNLADQVKDHKNVQWVGLLLAGRKLYVTSSLGKIFVLSPEKGLIEHTFSIPGPLYIPPVVAQKIMYFLNNSADLIAVH